MAETVSNAIITPAAALRLRTMCEAGLVTNNTIINAQLHRHFGEGIHINIVATPDIGPDLSFKDFEALVGKCLNEGATVYEGIQAFPTIRFLSPILGPATEETLTKPTVGVQYPPLGMGFDEALSEKYLKDTNILCKYVTKNGEFVIYTKDALDDIIQNDPLVTSISIVVPVGATVQLAQRLHGLYPNEEEPNGVKVIRELYSNLSNIRMVNSDIVSGWLEKNTETFKAPKPPFLNIMVRVILLSPVEYRVLEPYDLKAKMAQGLQAARLPYDRNGGEALYKELSRSQSINLAPNAVESQMLLLAEPVNPKNPVYSPTMRFSTPPASTSFLMYSPNRLDYLKVRKVLDLLVGYYKGEVAEGQPIDTTTNS